ncbi:MAG: PIN domain-containing protein, partial [Patescibacteria group bacterium]
MKYYLDTNVFLRFLIADDARAHEACQELFHLIETHHIKAVTSPLVCAEVVWVLGSFYKFPRSKISDALVVFARSPIAFDSRCDLLAAIEWYAAHPVKFVDALIASHPLLRRKKLTLISYDKD